LSPTAPTADPGGRNGIEPPPQAAPSSPGRLLVCVGDLMVDVAVAAPALARGGDVPGSVRLGPGGSAANVAVWARQAGAAALVVAGRGDDLAGRLLAAAAAVFVSGYPLLRAETRAAALAAAAAAAPRSRPPRTPPPGRWWPARPASRCSRPPGWPAPCWPTSTRRRP
jgi:hypothetical protein